MRLFLSFSNRCKHFISKVSDKRSVQAAYIISKKTPAFGRSSVIFQLSLFDKEIKS